MSTTPTKKDEKEVAREIAAMETVISSLSYTQLLELANSKKDKEIEAVQHKLKEAKGIVEALEAQLVNLGVTPAAPTTAKRSYPRKITGRAIVGNRKSAKTVKKAKRGAVGEAIVKFLSTKGKEGAHVKDIATAIGNTPANVTAYFYGGAGKKLAKALGGARFAIKK